VRSLAWRAHGRVFAAVMKPVPPLASCTPASFAMPPAFGTACAPMSAAMAWRRPMASGAKPTAVAFFVSRPAVGGQRQRHGVECRCLTHGPMTSGGVRTRWRASLSRRAGRRWPVDDAAPCALSIGSNGSGFSGYRTIIR